MQIQNTAQRRNLSARPHRLLASIAVLLLALCLSGPASAQDVPVHELRLVEGLEAYPLGLEGWLVDEGSVYTVIEVSPPAFGSIVDGEYRPLPSLWAAGIDHFGLEITPLVGPPERHDFLIMVLAPSTIARSTEGFEGGWPADWTSEGSPGSVTWEPDGISGGSLRAFLGAAGEVGHAGPAIDLPSGSKGYHAQGTGTTTIPDPPDNSLEGTATILNAASEASLAVSEGASVEMKIENGTHFLRAKIGCIAPGCRVQTTPWQPIPSDQPVRFELWSGPMVFHVGQGSLYDAVRFTIDRPAPLADTTDWLESDAPLGLPRLGFQEAQGLENVGLLFDDLEYWEEVGDAGRRLIVGDGFEDGGFDPTWTLVDGPTLVTPDGAIQGQWGTEIDVAAMRSGAGEAVIRTSAPASERQLRALFHLDLSELILGAGERIDLLRISRGQVTSGGLAARLLLRPAAQDPGRFEMMVRVLEADGTWRLTPWVLLEATGHQVGLVWRAGNGDGLCELWIDGTSAGRLDDLHNPSHRIETVGFGALSPNLTPSSSAYVTSLKIDEVILGR